MSDQNKKEQQKTKQAAITRQGSGSEYHRKHAGNVEGYGQPHPVDGSSNESNN
ncbi:hypothetical protein ABE096_13770 [Robertmurraya massiliosenegalensis]|uniref:hypothetical protein n=1 Tax=Robertmurraya TaxID=2837507 RepID=UPI0039A542C4